MVEKRFFTVAEMAKLTGFTKKKIQFETESGNIPFLKTSSGYLYELETIRECMIQNAEDARVDFEGRDVSRYVAGEGVDPTKLHKVYVH